MAWLFIMRDAFKAPNLKCPVHPFPFRVKNINIPYNIIPLRVFYHKDRYFDSHATLHEKLPTGKLVQILDLYMPFRIVEKK